jgi:hypothetical protein
MARSLVRLKLIEGLVLGSLGTLATHGVLIVPIASGIVLGRNAKVVLAELTYSMQNFDSTVCQLPFAHALTNLP